MIFKEALRQLLRLNLSILAIYINDFIHVCIQAANSLSMQIELFEIEFTQFIINVFFVESLTEIEQFEFVQCIVAINYLY